MIELYYIFKLRPVASSGGGVGPSTVYEMVSTYREGSELEPFCSEQEAMEFIQNSRDFSPMTIVKVYQRQPPNE